MTRDSARGSGTDRASAVEALVTAFHASCRPQVLAASLASRLGQVVRAEQAGSVLIVRPSSPAWSEIRIRRRADGQVDSLDLVPADDVVIGPEALADYFGQGSEGDRLHWEDRPVVDFPAVHESYRCSIFARLGHPVFDRDRPGIHRVTIRRDGEVRVEDGTAPDPPD
jgi:hypothetical protein